MKVNCPAEEHSGNVLGFNDSRLAQHTHDNMTIMPLSVLHVKRLPSGGDGVIEKVFHVRMSHTQRIS